MQGMQAMQGMQGMPCSQIAGFWSDDGTWIPGAGGSWNPAADGTMDGDLSQGGHESERKFADESPFTSSTHGRTFTSGPTPGSSETPGVESPPVQCKTNRLVPKTMFGKEAQMSLSSERDTSTSPVTGESTVQRSLSMGTSPGDMSLEPASCTQCANSQAPDVVAPAPKQDTGSPDLQWAHSHVSSLPGPETSPLIAVPVPSQCLAQAVSSMYGPYDGYQSARGVGTGYPVVPFSEISALQRRRLLQNSYPQWSSACASPPVRSSARKIEMALQGVAPGHVQNPVNLGWARSPDPRFQSQDVNLDWVASRSPLLSQPYRTEDTLSRSISSNPVCRTSVSRERPSDFGARDEWWNRGPRFGSTSFPQTAEDRHAGLVQQDVESQRHQQQQQEMFDQQHYQLPPSCGAMQQQQHAQVPHHQQLQQQSPQQPCHYEQTRAYIPVKNSVAVYPMQGQHMGVQSIQSTSSCPRSVQQQHCIPWQTPQDQIVFDTLGIPCWADGQPVVTAMKSEMDRLRDELNSERSLVDRNALHLNRLDLCCAELAQRLEESQVQLHAVREGHMMESRQLKGELGLALAERNENLTKTNTLQAHLQEEQLRHAMETQHLEKRLKDVEQHLRPFSSGSPHVSPESGGRALQSEVVSQESAGHLPQPSSRDATYSKAATGSGAIAVGPSQGLSGGFGTGPVGAGSAPRAHGWTIGPKRFAAYESAFRLADVRRDGYVERAQALDVLTEFRLRAEELTQVWNLSDVDRDGRLSFNEFLCAMHLAYRHAREGLSVPSTLPPELAALLPVGVLEPPPGAGPAPPVPSTKWTVDLQELEQYRAIFRTFDVGTGFMDGDAGRELFERSQLPTTELLHIWHLADVDRDGRLSQDEFLCAMAMLVRRRQGSELPLVLPPELLAVISHSKRPESRAEEGRQGFHVSTCKRTPEFSSGQEPGRQQLTDPSTQPLPQPPRPQTFGQGPPPCPQLPRPSEKSLATS